VGSTTLVPAGARVIHAVLNSLGSAPRSRAHSAPPADRPRPPSWRNVVLHIRCHCPATTDDGNRRRQRRWIGGQENGFPAPLKREPMPAPCRAVKLLLRPTLPGWHARPSARPPAEVTPASPPACRSRASGSEPDPHTVPVEFLDPGLHHEVLASLRALYWMCESREHRALGPGTLPWTSVTRPSVIARASR